MSGIADSAPADPAPSLRFSQRLISALIPLSAAIALGVIGVLALREAWGILCIAAAGLCLLMAVVSTWTASLWAGLYGTLLVLSLLLIAVGVRLQVAAAWSVGFASLVVTAATWPIAFHLRRLVEGSNRTKLNPAAAERMEELLRKIQEQSMLSDGAKRIIFRTQELDLLRGTIEQDIMQRDFDVAMLLCDELENRFGRAQDAEKLRRRVRDARGAQYDAQIQTALNQFDELLRRRNWPRVHEEEARLRRLFRDSSLESDLRERIARAREQHKHELERAFLELAQREDAEGAMEIMRDLDGYLTPNEAASLTEVAHGVVVKHRENLGVQFRLAVHDRRWAEALEIGKTIIDEFPNTRMAAEVRTLQDELRQRADRPRQRTA